MTTIRFIYNDVKSVKGGDLRLGRREVMDE
jgi:hypothetical protein